METQNLNGLDYTVKDRRASGSVTFDGGAIGGTFTQYPSGMCHNRDIGWQESAFVAAKACQEIQRVRFAEAVEFIEAWGVPTGLPLPPAKQDLGQMLFDAYRRGYDWAGENPGTRSEAYLNKAAADYVDKALSNG